MKRFEATLCKCRNGEDVIILRENTHSEAVGAVAVRSMLTVEVPALSPEDICLPELDLSALCGESQEKPEAQTVINSPKYYNRYSVEVVEMARRIWGDDALDKAAEITAFIYRMRAGTKPDNPFEVDINKENWWLTYKREKLHTENEIKYE